MYWCSEERKRYFQHGPLVQFKHPGLERCQSHVCHQKFEEAYNHNWQVSAVDALFRCSDSFIPGSLSLCWTFWESHILKGHPLKNDILSWLKHGVQINYFLAPVSKGTYNGVEINSHLPQTYKEQNHVKQEFKEWVSSEINSLVQMGVLKEWSMDSMGSPTPVVIAPLLVEPSKPRLIYDARYINCFMELPSVQMFGIGKIPSSCWKGMFMISMDHKSGYYHVPIHPECWKYFGVSWEDKIYCYVTLSFG